MPRARLNRVLYAAPHRFALKLVGVALLAMACASSPVRAEIFDDKMMPPILLVPPPPSEEELSSDAAEDDFFADDGTNSDPSLSVFIVPTLDIPSQGEGVRKERPMRIGTFSLLHKVTAKVRDISLHAGEEVTIGALTLTMQDCISTPPEEPPETKSFLQVSEFKNGADRSLFSGWMFASSPGIHALEHAVYDLWPLSCETEDGMIFTGEILPPTRTN